MMTTIAIALTVSTSRIPRSFTTLPTRNTTAFPTSEATNPESGADTRSTMSVITADRAIATSTRESGSTTTLPIGTAFRTEISK
jgi:hypothetical protein